MNIYLVNHDDDTLHLLASHIQMLLADYGWERYSDHFKGLYPFSSWHSEWGQITSIKR